MFNQKCVFFFSYLILIRLNLSISINFGVVNNKKLSKNEINLQRTENCLNRTFNQKCVSFLSYLILIRFNLSVDINLGVVNNKKVSKNEINLQQIKKNCLYTVFNQKCKFFFSYLILIRLNLSIPINLGVLNNEMSKKR